MQSYVEELLPAARSGFDGVTVTEHSQSSYDLSPNPDLTAAILAHTTRVEGLDTAINVLGRSLGKSREPLRIAEEYAVIDNLSGGKLIAGLPVGLSYDANQNGGIPPIETRARYREGRALLEKAWSAREPFAWNGKYSRYPVSTSGRARCSSRGRRSGSPAAARRARSPRSTATTRSSPTSATSGRS